MLTKILDLLFSNVFPNIEPKDTYNYKEDLRERTDLRTTQTHCPICLNQLTLEDYDKYDYNEGHYTIYIWSCKNKCYRKRKETCETYFDIDIFGERFKIGMYSVPGDDSQEKIWNKIHEWTYRKKYLMKILEDEL